MAYIGNSVVGVEHPSTSALNATTGAFTGNVTTTGTVEPAGDTAAGDDAAIGYTSAEGLILTGQGSTSDITLKNDADATVFTVPTGTDDILFPDNSEIQMGAGADLKVFSDGANAILRANNGRVYIQTDTGVNLTKTGNAETMFIATPDGSVDLYHNNSKKFETTSTGATITGATVTASGGSASAPAYAVTSGSLGANGLFVPSANTLGFSSAGTERMRIDSSGHVGIGTTTLTGSGTPDETDNATGIRILSSGFIGIGRDAGICGQFNRNNAGAILGFRRAGGEVGTISVSSSATAYNTSSDYRLKTAVTYDWDATTRLKQLKPARFKWIVDGDDAEFVDGFIADEAQTVVPESVTGTKDEVELWTEPLLDADGNIISGEALPDGVSAGDNKLDADGNTIPVMQGIDQAKIVPLLTKALIESVTKIEALEARITALENA